MGQAGPQATAGSLVGEVWSQGILGPVLAHWWMKLGPGVCGYRSLLGVLGLVPVHRCVGLGAGPSGGHGCVQGQLWAQGFLMQPVCLWMGLCHCPVSSLARGIPVLVPAGWWVGAGLGPEANKLEGEFQNGDCQHQWPCGRMSSPKWLPPLSMSPG